MAIETYTIGSDPEAFLFSKKDQRFTPSIGLIGGGKRNPKPVKEGFAMLEDNVMVEYNIPPSDMGTALAEHIEFMTYHIQNVVLKGEYEMKYIPSVVFDETQLQHKQAKEFGCEPDYDVWLEEGRSLGFNDSNVRYAGGHIHFGNPELDQMDSVKLVKLFDLYLGVPSVLIDKDSQRRNAYGKAGAFRFKPYGFEYRSLSNFWVNQHEELILTQIKQAIEAYNNDFDASAEKDNIIKAINVSDEDEAKRLITKYNLHV